MSFFLFSFSFCAVDFCAENLVSLERKKNFIKQTKAKLKNLTVDIKDNCILIPIAGILSSNLKKLLSFSLYAKKTIT